MTQPDENSVVMKTAGKVATPVRGSGTALVTNSATKKHVKGPRVVPVKGRKAVARSARAH